MSRKCNPRKWVLEHTNIQHDLVCHFVRSPLTHSLLGMRGGCDHHAHRTTWDIWRLKLRVGQCRLVKVRAGRSEVKKTRGELAALKLVPRTSQTFSGLERPLAQAQALNGGHKLLPPYIRVIQVGLNVVLYFEGKVFWEG